MNDAELDQYLSGSATIDVAHSDPSFALSGRGKLSDQGIGLPGRATHRKQATSDVKPAQDKLSAATMSEEELKRNVIDVAHVFGWKVAHFRPAKTEKGWRTPVEGDSGFVDLVLARNGIIWLIELKSQRGVLSDAQISWQSDCTNYKPGQNRYVVWRPSDWIDGKIERVLQ